MARDLQAELDDAERLRREGELDEAARACGTILRAAPGDAAVLLLAGRIQLQRDRPAEAVPLLRAAVEAAPDRPAPHALLGEALLRTRRLASAIGCFEAAAARATKTDTVAALEARIASVYRNAFARVYEARLGKPLRLDPPRSWSAHITHRLLHDRDPRLKTVCDKAATKRWVAGLLGEDRVVPSLAIWSEEAEIDFAALPAAFALKPSHMSGAFEAVPDKSAADLGALAETCRAWLKRDYFDQSLEWGYRGVPRRVLVEPLMTKRGTGLVEVQAHVFRGRVGLMCQLWGTKRTPERAQYMFDRQGRPLSIRTVKGTYRRENHFRDHLPEILRMAETMARDFTDLRVDVFLTDSGPRINELTAYPNAGTRAWNPPELDERLGALFEGDFAVLDPFVEEQA